MSAESIKEMKESIKGMKDQNVRVFDNCNKKISELIEYLKIEEIRIRNVGNQHALNNLYPKDVVRDLYKIIKIRLDLEMIEIPK